MKQKKWLFTIAGLTVCMMMAFGMTGCGSDDQAATEESTEATTEVESTVAESETTVAEETTTAAASQEQAAIDEAKAMEIALNDAGLSSSEVTNSYVHIDYDDGIQKYEVSFFKDATEYEYDIDASSGAIIEKDIDTHEDDD